MEYRHLSMLVWRISHPSRLGMDGLVEHLHPIKDRFIGKAIQFVEATPAIKAHSTFIDVYLRSKDCALS